MMKQTFKLCALLVVLLVWITSFSFAEIKVVALQDAALEQRAKDLSLELRCLVCQNQSIESSDADLANDLKILVREQILTGKTNTQIKTFLVERYGQFVLLNPQFNTQNSFLWLTPILFLGLAFIFAFIYFRRMKTRNKQ